MNQYTTLSRRILIAICFSLALRPGQAQVGPPTSGTGINNGYTFSSTIGTYTPLTGGTVFQAGNQLNTNAVTDAVPLGFTFPYNGRTYTEVYIHNNGFMSLGGDKPLPATYKAIAVFSPFSHGVIAPCAAKLEASGVAGAAPEIRYGADGFEFVVQWQDVYETGDSPSGQISFQARLGPTGQIRFVYGNMNIPVDGSIDCQAGIRGADVYDAFNLDGQNNHSWVNPNPSSHPWNDFGIWNTTTSLIPPAGLTWTFSPGKTPAPALFATTPYAQSFDDAWHNYLGTSAAVPDSAHWRAWPMRGNNAWRKDDVPITSSMDRNSGWSDPDRGRVAVSPPASGRAARFHSSLVLPTTPRLSYGYLDLYIDLSAPGPELVQWDWSNETGTDSLVVFLSTDAGTTFTRVFGKVRSGFGWQTDQVTLQTDSPTCIIRFMGIGDTGPNTGTNDLYLDNVTISTTTAAMHALPGTALALVPNPASQEITIQGLPHNSGSTLKVYDSAGRLLLAREAVAGNTLYSLAGLPSGFYMVKVETATDFWTGRLAISR